MRNPLQANPVRIGDWFDIEINHDQVEEDAQLLEKKLTELREQAENRLNNITQRVHSRLNGWADRIHTKVKCDS